MTRNEINEFIETMEEIGDVWEAEDVERVYGDYTLESALSERKSEIGQFGKIIETVLNH